MSIEADGRRCLVLILNAGSSSLKAGLFSVDPTRPAAIEPLLRLAVANLDHAPRLTVRNASGARLCERAAGEVAPGSYESALDAMLVEAANSSLQPSEIAAAGHRVVHGGATFSAPICVTPLVIDELERLIPLAPHHQPANVAGIRAIARLLPGVPQVAVFDTAFHATQPDIATRLPLPRDYFGRGYRRYGFHGISYQTIVENFAAATGSELPERLIVAHLGNGASMCAIKKGSSIATTMGYSTLDGLMMGTRSGTIDPGALIALMREDGLDADALEHLLYDRSGLFGISGLSSDMRTLIQSPEPAAAEAVALYCYSAARHAGSLMAALGGCDGIVFTGGIGENAPAVRAGIIAHLSWMEAVLDPEANARNAIRVSAAGSRIAVFAIPTDEERSIARETTRLAITSAE